MQLSIKRFRRVARLVAWRLEFGLYLYIRRMSGQFTYWAEIRSFWCAIRRKRCCSQLKLGVEYSIAQEKEMCRSTAHT